MYCYNMNLISLPEHEKGYSIRTLMTKWVTGKNNKDPKNSSK